MQFSFLRCCWRLRMNHAKWLNVVFSLCFVSVCIFNMYPNRWTEHSINMLSAVYRLNEYNKKNLRPNGKYEVQISNIRARWINKIVAFFKIRKKICLHSRVRASNRLSCHLNDCPLNVFTNNEQTQKKSLNSNGNGEINRQTTHKHTKCLFIPGINQMRCKMSQTNNNGKKKKKNTQTGNKFMIANKTLSAIV